MSRTRPILRAKVWMRRCLLRRWRGRGQRSRNGCWRRSSWAESARHRVGVGGAAGWTACVCGTDGRDWASLENLLTAKDGGQIPPPFFAETQGCSSFSAPTRLRKPGITLVLGLVLHGQRFTPAVVPVTRSESLKQVLQELLALVSKMGLKIGLLLLDRGFYSVEVIRYLQQARRPFLMPMVCHGRTADHPLGPSASNVCKAMQTSGWYTYTLQDGENNKATVSVCVKRAWDKHKHGKRKRATWVYAYWGIAPRRVDWVKDTYRRRFGIETSYRPMNQCRIRTTTRKFNVRFLYVAIGLLLRNLWVRLHHFVLSSPRRGCRRYTWERLRVERILLWLEEVAKIMYGLVNTIETERHVPESVPS